MRPTVHDIAEAAGVSLATVDRVLNRRPGVRARMVEKVEDAVLRLGYVRDLTAANLARQRTYRFVFLLPEGDNPFMRALEAELDRARERAVVDRLDLSVRRVPAFDGNALAAALDGIDPQAVSGVALVAVGTPAVESAVERLTERGVPVITLVSDLPDSGRAHFAGIDNVAAGRTAASLLGRFIGERPGRVAVLAGSMLVRDHVERRRGFGEVMACDFPRLGIVPLMEAHDDPAEVARAVGDCIRRHPDVVGLYSLGAGNSGLLKSLSRRQSGPRIAVVAHELDASSRRALEEGFFDAVIAQDPGHEIRSAIRVLRAKADGMAIVPAQERIRIEIYLGHNLPAGDGNEYHQEMEEHHVSRA